MKKYPYWFLSIHSFEPKFSVGFWKSLQCYDSRSVKNIHIYWSY